MEERILHGGLKANQVITFWAYVEVMPVQPPGRSMDREELQVKAQPPLVVRDVFYDGPRVDDIAVIRAYAPCAAGDCVGIVHRRHEPERLKVLSPHDAFREREPPEFAGRKAPQGRESSGDGVRAERIRAEPLTRREAHSVVGREGAFPRVRVLYAVARLDVNRGVP